MPSFSIWNHEKNNLFFTIWIQSWTMSRIPFLFLSKTLWAFFTLFFSILFFFFFSIIFFWWKIYSFPVIFIYRRFNFCYSSRIFSSFFMIYWDCYSVLKAFIFYLFIRFIVAFLVFIQSVESTYDPSQFKFILWYL